MKKETTGRRRNVSELTEAELREIIELYTGPAWRSVHFIASTHFIDSVSLDAFFKQEGIQKKRGARSPHLRRGEKMDSESGF